VVSPLVFPGAVTSASWRVNDTGYDLAMSGARPLSLPAGFVLEEGFPTGEQRPVVASMARTPERAGCGS
jgi:hydrogenase expression/formation protein HypE